jgi:hypothetical protein
MTDYDFRAGTVNNYQELKQAILLDTIDSLEYIQVYVNGDRLDNGIHYLLIFDKDKITVKFLDNNPINMWDSYYIRWAFEQSEGEYSE